MNCNWSTFFWLFFAFSKVSQFVLKLLQSFSGTFVSLLNGSIADVTDPNPLHANLSVLEWFFWDTFLSIFSPLIMEVQNESKCWSNWNNFMLFKTSGKLRLVTGVALTEISLLYRERKSKIRCQLLELWYDTLTQVKYKSKTVLFRCLNYCVGWKVFRDS